MNQIWERVRNYLGFGDTTPATELTDYWEPDSPPKTATSAKTVNTQSAESDLADSTTGRHWAPSAADLGRKEEETSDSHSGVAGHRHDQAHSRAHAHAHGHSHSHGPLNLTPSVAHRARLTLAVIIIPLLLATLLGIFWLWPTGQTGVGTQAQISKGVKQGRVVVIDQPLSSCQLDDAAGGGTAIGVNPQANGTTEFEHNNSGNPGQPGASGNKNSRSQTGTGNKNDSPLENTPQVDNDENGNLGQPGTKGAAQGMNKDLLDSAVCARVTKGIGVGKIVPVHIPPEFMAAVKVGTEIKVLYDGSALDSGTPYVFWDIARGKSLALLAVAYIVLVIAVAGTRGLRALFGLLASTLVLVFYVLPALMIGQPPMLVTITGAGAMMFLSVYFAHGVTIRTTTALIGTFLGLAITVVLASWGTEASGLSGATSDDAQMLITYFPNLALPALFTCGVVIAGLGALNDVTITQASAVWELNEANPNMNGWKLFGRAMRIGRDHIASTVYTLAFAYAGTALPTLILAIMVDRTAIELLTVADIAEEIVRTLVASIGLIISIPATTAVGTFLVKWVQSGAAAKPKTAKNSDSAVQSTK